MTGAEFWMADFSRANLRGVRFENASCAVTTFVDALIEGARWEGCRRSDGHFGERPGWPEGVEAPTGASGGGLE